VLLLQLLTTATLQALEDLSMQYDSTVRNSEQTVVQFAYGDDGLNPQCMETTIKVTMDKQPKPVDVSVFLPIMTTAVVLSTASISGVHHEQSDHICFDC
jgi:hypothetical protein